MAEKTASIIQNEKVGSEAPKHLEIIPYNGDKLNIPYYLNTSPQGYPKDVFLYGEKDSKSYLGNVKLIFTHLPANTVYELLRSEFTPYYYPSDKTHVRDDYMSYLLFKDYGGYKKSDDYAVRQKQHEAEEVRHITMLYVIKGILDQKLSPQKRLDILNTEIPEVTPSEKTGLFKKKAESVKYHTLEDLAHSKGFDKLADALEKWRTELTDQN